MVGRSEDLQGITQPHWVALYGLLGNTRMTRDASAQKRREAGRPVRADMALDGRFLLCRLTYLRAPGHLSYPEGRPNTTQHAKRKVVVFAWVVGPKRDQQANLGLGHY